MTTLKGTRSWAWRAVRERAAFAGCERGVTLIELIVALSVFAFISAGVTIGMGGALNLTRNNRNRSVAANLAAMEMDTIRSEEFEDLPLGLIETTETVDNVDYTIRRSSSWVTQGGSTGACDSPGGSRPAYLRATVSVLWPNMSGAEPPTSQTIITPPVGGYDPNSGHLAVKVLDSDAQLAPGHAVTVTPIAPPGAPDTQITTDEGCAFFPFLAAGSYNVAVSTVGNVDTQGVGAPETSAAVSVGVISSVQFDYDDSSTLELTLGQDPAFPVPSGVPVTLANPALQPSGAVAYTGSGTVRTFSDLYPFNDQYRAWTGDCPDADPASLGTVVPAEPGQLSSAIIEMERVRVTVVDALGNPRGSIPVTASHDAVPGACTATTLNLGSTDAIGRVDASLPYGAWNLKAGGITQAATLDPAAGDPTMVLVVVP